MYIGHKQRMPLLSVNCGKIGKQYIGRENFHLIHSPNHILTHIILHFSQLCNIFLIIASFFQKTVARATILWYNICNDNKERVILWDPETADGADPDMNMKKSKSPKTSKTFRAISRSFSEDSFTGLATSS
jgi:hypothetical protein